MDAPGAARSEVWGAVELIPSRAAYLVGEPVTIELRGEVAAGELMVRRLGEPVLRVSVDGPGFVPLGALPGGGYGVELDGVRTAIEVHAVGRQPSSLRYGFAVSYRPDEDVTEVVDTARRLHLTHVQLYDWAYRHADLLGGGPDYLDPLGQPVSLDTVRRLALAVQESGIRAIGYAAVYGVGAAEWPSWQHAALMRPTGEPYALGDFLRVVDPAAADWLEHVVADLRLAVEQVGLDGFHLDQYGWPKTAVRADGVRVDVASSFAALLARVRASLPQATLIFNNVNDFPTWATAGSAQDAVYIEVWHPHDRLEHLAATVTRARALGGGTPVVVAAYLTCFASETDTRATELAAAYTMATLFSHGATHLFAGADGRVLVDPYYPRNHAIGPTTAALLRRWWDFAVEHGELLFDPAAVEVTASVVGSYNDDLDITVDGSEVDHLARPGALWRRVVRLPDGRLVVHVIDLLDQTDTRWDAPRQQVSVGRVGRIRLRRTGPGMPRVQVASPEPAPGGSPWLTDVPLEERGDWVEGDLPLGGVWTVVLVDDR